MLAVAHGDHEVGADEHHDLAGGDDLAGGGQLVVVEVGDGLEYDEEGVAVTLDLGALVGLDGVLDGEGVQPEDLGQPLDLGGLRLVQPDPDVRVVDLGGGVVLADEADGLRDAGDVDALAGDIGAELHE